MRLPPVTVLIPAFNAMPYLRDAVESTLVQSYYEIELLVVNDGSTDATQEFLEGVGDPRIRVITQSNQGLVASLNRGLEAASHEFIARLDADDIMDKRRIKRQLEFLVDNPDFSLVATGYGFIRENSTPMPIRVRPRVANAPYFDPLVDPNILHTGVMYRRSVVLSLGGYRDLVPAEDLDLWLRMAEHTSLAAIPDVLTYVRVRSDGITWQGFEKQRMMWMYIKDCAAARRSGLSEPSLREWELMNVQRMAAARRTWRAAQEWRAAGLHFAGGHWFGALRSIVRASVSAPGFVMRKAASYLGRN